MKQILALALSSLLALPAAHAQTQVTPYQPGLTPDGITYFLPRTYVHVTVTAVKHHYTPGEYCQYANRHLRLPHVTLTETDEWTIEGVELQTYGLADPTQAYTIKLNSKTAAPLVSLTPDGRLLTVNAEQEYTEPQLSAAKVEQLDPAPLERANYKTQDILLAGSTAKMAELTAAEIYDIRENRNLLTKGQADFMPKDGEQLRLMLANLDTQEKALLELFTG